MPIDSYNINFPQQALSLSKKTQEWREKCIRFADKNSIISSSTIRRTAKHKKINYDLLNGIVSMDDIENILNPEGVDYGVKSKPIQHYPILNAKIQLLMGEERASQFEFKVVVSNPNAISEIEEKKRNAVIASMQEQIENESLNDEEYQAAMQKVQHYYTYEWQELRERNANYLLNHYNKEQNFDEIFNDGFMDVLANNEEIYQCTIESGEPVLRRLNPLKINTFGSGYSSKIEDSDMITIEDFWPKGRIIDTFYDELTDKDIKKLDILDKSTADSQYGDRGNPLNYFRNDNEDEYTIDEDGNITFNDGVKLKDLPYDMYGNIRVLQVYWKSLREIKIVHYFDENGEEQIKFRDKDEKYTIDENNGETEKSCWINEAWHGVMIGAGKNAIFVDCGPCKIQYNNIYNPSKCHFGIIGTIYNINESKPYSIVDMLKPLSHLYDVIKSRLNVLMARNIGKLINMDLARIPAGWEPEKWMYFAKQNGFIVTDSFKEGNIGIAKGKLAGGIANTPLVVDVELGNSIQYMINFLEYIKNEMGDIVGITPQRQGMISNRETVGGVERATIQSSHSTRWYFAKHDDTKKRVMSCFLENAKIAFRGKSKKFSYIMPDNSHIILDIDGDNFAECDYGLIVDNGYDMQALNQSIDQMSQAAMQNGMLTFSSFLKLKENSSLADKIHIIEDNENEARQRAEQSQQQQMQMEQQKNQIDMQMKQAEMKQTDEINQRDNDTKIFIAKLSAKKEAELKAMDNDGDGIIDNYNGDEIEREKLRNDLIKFNKNLELENDKLRLQEKIAHENNVTKEKIASVKNVKNN